MAPRLLSRALKWACRRNAVAVEPAGLWTCSAVQFSFGLPGLVSLSWGLSVALITPVLGQMRMLVVLFRFLVRSFGVGAGDVPGVQCGHLPAGQPLWGAVCLARAPVGNKASLHQSSTSFILSPPLGTRPQTPQPSGTCRKSDFPVFLWNQRNFLRPVLLQATAWKLREKVGSQAGP